MTGSPEAGFLIEFFPVTSAADVFAQTFHGSVCTILTMRCWVNNRMAL